MAESVVHEIKGRLGVNLLFVSHVMPWPADQGTRQRVFHILHALCQSHSVTLVVLSPEPDIASGYPDRDQLSGAVVIDPTSDQHRKTPGDSMWGSPLSRLRSIVGSRLPDVVQRWWSPRVVEQLTSLGRSTSFDVVWVERMFLAEMVHCAGFRNVVVDVDELESGSLSRLIEHRPKWYWSKPLHLMELAKTRSYERRLASRFSGLVVCKDEDLSGFGSGGAVLQTIPNGASSKPPLARSREREGQVLFVGSLDYQPNIDGVSWFCARVLPDLDDCVLTIVGREPVPAVLALANGKKCVIEANVPDVTPYYASAAVVVAPIWLGGGTKLKVLEALAFGKALVASAVAVEGLNLRPGIDYCEANDANGFREACKTLLADAKLRDRLGASGREFVESRFNWQHIGQSAVSLAERVQLLSS